MSTTQDSTASPSMNAPQRTPAPHGRRFLAFTVDVIITSFLMDFVTRAMLKTMGGDFAQILSGDISKLENMNLENINSMLWTLIAMLAVCIVVFHGYFLLMEWKWGATLGKRLLGLKVISENDSSLTFSQCVKREIFREIDCLLVIPGLISMLTTPGHQRLGDRSAKTLVVRSDL